MSRKRWNFEANDDLYEYLATCEANHPGWENLSDEEQGDLLIAWSEHYRSPETQEFFQNVEASWDKYLTEHPEVGTSPS